MQRGSRSLPNLLEILRHKFIQGLAGGQDLGPYALRLDALYELVLTQK